MFSGNMSMPSELCHLSPPSQKNKVKGVQLSQGNSTHFIRSM